MAVLVIIVLILSLAFVYLTNTKIEHLEIRSKAKKISAEVVEYRKERVQMRNDYTELNYPYVKIDLDNGECTIKKLRYANSWNQPIEIGQQVDVFWYGGELLLWNAYDSGFYKLLPVKWFFK